MIIIEYCKEGEAISDFDYQSFVERVLWWLNHNDSNYTFKVSTSIPIEAIRAEIAEGHIGCEEVRFIFNDKIVPINRYGSIQDWPDGFCDTNILLLERILHAAIIRHKKEKR